MRSKLPDLTGYRCPVCKQLYDFGTDGSGRVIAWHDHCPGPRQYQPDTPTRSRATVARTCEECGGSFEQVKHRRVRKVCYNPMCRKRRTERLKAKRKTCRNGCLRPTLARGVCGSCYSAEWKRQNPEGAKALAKAYQRRRRSAAA